MPEKMKWGCGKMSQEKKIDSYVKEIEGTLDVRKAVSLFKLMKKKCPDTIRILTEKLNGKKFIYIPDKKNKWYTWLLNYLVKLNVLSLETREDGSIHRVNEDYIKYFTTETSTIYSEKNCQEHIKLWSENALEFLEKARITDSNGCEIMQIKKKKKNNSFFSKYEKQIKWIMNIILFATTANFVFMISKYGLKEITPFLSNTCLFTMSCIVLSTNEKK